VQHRAGFTRNPPQVRAKQAGDPGAKALRPGNRRLFSLEIFPCRFISSKLQPIPMILLRRNFLRLASAALFAMGSALAAEPSPDTFQVGALSFKRPAEWSWVPVQSPMRKAQLAVPGLDPSKPADITFFHFGPSGGGDLDSNVQRWLRQFQSTPGAEKVETKTVGGRQTTLVSTEGTFSSGMPGQPAAPMENYALLGAIVEDPAGSVFVKMTGPAATVKAARARLLEFLEQAKHESVK